MNPKLLALYNLCSSINKKIDTQKSLAGFIDDQEYVKQKEVDCIKDCCFLLAKFMQDNGMKEVEVVEPAY